MKSPDTWKPSKFVISGGSLRASRNPADVGVFSRLIVDLVAQCYDAHLRAHARGRLLDLGCGKVPLFGTYRDFVTDTVCIDWPNSWHGNQHLDYELDITQPLPFEDAEFDTILLSDVLEHLPEPGKLWQEMARLLAPVERSS